MGITEVLEDTKINAYKTWDRIKVNLGGANGTVIFAAGSYTSVVMDNSDELYLYLQSEITKIDEKPKRLSFQLLSTADFDFGMTVFDITLNDGSVVEWCYKKENKFLEVSAPHRQFGFWDVSYLLPHF